jgi:hypothetical protein
MFSPDFRRSLFRELIVDLGLVLAGLLLLPIAVYFVGQLVFGPYQGEGYAGFFSAVTDRLGGGEASAWFLVLSPLILVSILRSAWWGWQKTATRERGEAGITEL